MLSKKRRLNRVAFPTVSKGKMLLSPSFSLKIAKNTHEMGRFSVVVSKKVAKTAVARNNLRRQVYSIVEKANIPNISAIFYMKNEAVGVSFKELHTEIMNLLGKI